MSIFGIRRYYLAPASADGRRLASGAQIVSEILMTSAMNEPIPNFGVLHQIGRATRVQSTILRSPQDRH